MSIVSPTVTDVPSPLLSPENEAFLARLTRAAYETALRHRPQAAFTDLELSLWRELREVFRGKEEEAACQRSADVAESGVYRILRRRSGRM